MPRAVPRWVVAGAVWLALLAAVPGATTPLRSDDQVNSGIPQTMRDSGLGLWGFLVEWLGPWVTDEGRFFPGSALWTLGVFTVLDDVRAYKLFVAGLVLLGTALVALAAATLARSPAVGVAVLALAPLTLTLRTWFDGLDTFSGVVPLTVVLSIGATCLLLRRPGWAPAVAAALLWTYALVTYEVAITLLPVLVALVWWHRRRFAPTLALLVPAAVVMAVVLWLRAVATGSDGNAYRINLEPARVLVTYVKQAGAALPLSEQWFPGGAGLEVPVDRVLPALVLVGVPLVAVLAGLRRHVDVRTRDLAPVALLGAALWLLPPVLVAISLGWQNELPRGQGYVSVVWGYLGVALLAGTVWAWLASRSTRTPGRIRALVVHAASLVLAVVASASLAQSATVALLVRG